MAKADPTRPVLGVIAVLSILFNATLCLVIMRKRNMLKKSYSILIFTLAITDTFTGLFMLVSPHYVLGQESLPVPEGTAGQMFCRIIFRGYFVWVLNKFSVYLVTCMAIERWFAIAKPNRYIIYFTTRRTLYYVIPTFLLLCSWEIKLVFETPMEVVNSTRTCVFRSLITDKSGIQCWAIMMSVFGLFLPVSFIMATYFHLRFVVRKRINRCQNMRLRTQAEIEMKISRMGLSVVLFMAICLIPNQISYNLSKFDLVVITSPGHNATVVLSLLSSCINPFIYCFTSKVYREEFVRLLSLCKCTLARVMCEATHEVTPDVTPMAKPMVTLDVTLEDTRDATPEATPEVTLKISPQVRPNTTPMVTLEVSPKITPESHS